VRERGFESFSLPVVNSTTKSELQISRPAHLYEHPNGATGTRSAHTAVSVRNDTSGYAALFSGLFLGLEFCAGTAEGGEGAAAVASHFLDVFDAAEAVGGPVVIDGDAANAFEAEVAKELPGGGVVDIAFVFFGGFFGVGKPDDGITGSFFGDGFGEGVKFCGGGEEGEGESDFARSREVAKDGYTREAGEFGLEGAGALRMRISV
jgi:hypothetical protein